MRKILLLFLVLSGVVSLLVTCTGDLNKVKEVDWNLRPEAALPVAKATFSLADAFRVEDDSTLYLSSDIHGLLHFIIKKDLETMSLKELFLGKIEKEAILSDTLKLPKPPRGYSIESPVTYFRLLFDSLNFEQQIDTLMLNDGNIEFDFQTWQHYDLELSVTLPDITNDEGKSPGFSNFKPTASDHKIGFSLKNCRLKINTSPTSKGVFTVVLGYKILTKSGGSDIPDPGIGVNLSGLDIHAAYGKISSFSIEMEPQGGSLPQFEFIESDGLELDLADPEITLLALNQIGVPFLLDSIRLNVYKDKQSYGVTGIQESLFVDAPPMGSGGVFTVNPLQIAPWSNIDLLFSKLPERYDFAGKVVLNPYDPEGYNFMTEDDQLQMRIEADIPLRFSLKDLIITNSTNTTFKIPEKLNDLVDLIRLQVKIRNHLPLELKLQAYFNDERQQVIDSLFSIPVHIKPAGSEGISSESLFIVDKEARQLRELQRTRGMLIRAEINTVGETPVFVEFNANQSIEIEINAFTRFDL